MMKATFCLALHWLGRYLPPLSITDRNFLWVSSTWFGSWRYFWNLYCFPVIISPITSFTINVPREWWGQKGLFFSSTLLGLLNITIEEQNTKVTSNRVDRVLNLARRSCFRLLIVRGPNEECYDDKAGTIRHKIISLSHCQCDGDQCRGAGESRKRNCLAQNAQNWKRSKTILLIPIIEPELLVSLHTYLKSWHDWDSLDFLLAFDTYEVHFQTTIHQ